MVFSSKEQELLNFQINRLIKNLIRNNLNLIADIKEEKEATFDKIYELLLEEDKHKLDLLDYFDDNKFNYIRKKILDLTNDYLREFETILGNYDIQFKEEKVNRPGDIEIQRDRIEGDSREKPVLSFDTQDSGKKL